jgi:hypothetical protein
MQHHMCNDEIQQAASFSEHLHNGAKQKFVTDAWLVVKESRVGCGDTCSYSLGEQFLRREALLQDPVTVH